MGGDVVAAFPAAAGLTLQPVVKVPVVAAVSPVVEAGDVCRSRLAC